MRGKICAYNGDDCWGWYAAAQNRWAKKYKADAEGVFLQVTVATTLVVIAKIWKGGTGQQYDRDRKIVNFTVAV